MRKIEKPGEAKRLEREFDAVLRSRLPGKSKTKYIEVLSQQKISSIQIAISVLKNPETPPPLQELLCWVLARLNVKKAAKPILRLLEEEKTDISMTAATALSYLEIKSILPGLTRIARKSPQRMRREAACYALSFMRDKRAAKTLLAIFRNRKETAAVRSQAAEGLGNYRYRAAFRPLVAGLTDRNAAIRFWSIFALGQIGDNRAIPYLQQIAKTDTAKVPGWWSIKKEAKDMIKSIQMLQTDGDPAEVMEC